MALPVTTKAFTLTTDLFSWYLIFQSVLDSRLHKKLFKVYKPRGGGGGVLQQKKICLIKFAAFDVIDPNREFDLQNWFLWTSWPSQ